MKSSALFSLVAAVSSLGFATAQEAARFGAVSVSPSTVKPGDKFTVHYNSTLARWQPKYYDAYLTGQLANGFSLPSFLLSRNDYGADTKFLDFETTLPAIDSDDPNEGYQHGATYNIIAYITFPTEDGPDSPLEYGGVGTPLTVDV